jgi:hypothetical protein
MNNRMISRRRAKPYSFRALLATLIGAWICGGAVMLWACNVPVFRYAMAYWEPDPFRVVLLHRGPLADEVQDEVTELQNAARDSDRPANLELILVDLDQPLDENLQPLLAGMREPETLPWLHVAYPVSSRLPQPAFSAPWESGLSAALVDSPARREIVSRLADGDAAVWVMLTSSDSDADAQAEALIREELPNVTERLIRGNQVAGTDSSLGGQGLLLDDSPDVALAPSNVPLKFSLFTIDRNDDAERVFVSMLLGSESDLVDFDSPIVMPVFGRGRSYYALVGAGITASNLFELSAFLVGSCSCEVKADNPGTDLLFAANWQSMAPAELLESPPLPALTGLGAFESGNLVSSAGKSAGGSPAGGNGQVADSGADAERIAAGGGERSSAERAEADAAMVTGSGTSSARGIPLGVTVLGVLVLVLALATIGTLSVVRRTAV